MIILPVGHQEFISDDSAQQYLPNVANIRAALVDSCSSRSEQAKRAILRSSSLLEVIKRSTWRLVVAVLTSFIDGPHQEISSRQLSNSLSAFFDHVRSSLTNASFLSTRLNPDHRNRMDAIIEAENGTSDTTEKDRRLDEDSLELARMILSTEREVTAGLRHLRTLGRCCFVSRHSHDRLNIILVNGPAASRNDSHATYQSTSLLDVAEVSQLLAFEQIELLLLTSLHGVAEPGHPHDGPESNLPAEQTEAPARAAPESLARTSAASQFDIDNQAHRPREWCRPVVTSPRCSSRAPEGTSVATTATAATQSAAAERLAPPQPGQGAGSRSLRLCCTDSRVEVNRDRGVSGGRHRPQARTEAAVSVIKLVYEHHISSSVHSTLYGPAGDEAD